MTRRNGTTLDQEAARELAAVDAALRGEAVERRDADLAELVELVRTERPRPRPQWAGDLDEAVAEGFAARRGGAGSRLARRGGAGSRLAEGARQLRERLPGGLLLPSFATAASLLLVVVVGTSLLRSGGGAGTQTVDMAEPAQQPKSREAAPSGGAASTISPASGTASAPEGDREAGAPATPGRTTARKVERITSLTLATGSGEIDDVADEVVRVTDGHRGVVTSSSVNTDDASGGGASFELRIPSHRLQPALAELSKLAHVRSRSQTTADVTRTYVSARDRLNEALAERRGLLGQLARADTPNETANVRRRLRLAAGRISRARSELASIRQRTDLSQVRVSIEPRRGDEGTGGPWTPREALGDALSILSVTLGVIVVSLAVLLPVGLLGGASWLGARGVRRRRREAALDAL